MNIVALTKTYRGHEFAIASLECIYEHVAAVVYIHSDTAWTGERAGNTVRPLIAEWVEKNDKAGKIVQIDYDSAEQGEQYARGWNYINDEIDHDWIMLHDTDEIYCRADMERALGHLERIPATFRGACVQMDAYMKSPLYRVAPRYGLRPVVFVRRAVVLSGTRGSDVRPRFFMADVTMHHFTSVRHSLSAVWQKHVASCSTENEPMREQAEWVEQVWNRLPRAQNIAPLTAYGNIWKGVQVITPEQLPEAVREHPMVAAFAEYDFQTKYAPEVAVATPDAPAARRPKRTKYNLVHYKGRMALFTVVDKAYAPFLPLWVWCARWAYPDYDPVVLVRAKECPGIPGARIESLPDDYPPGGYTTAALRFVLGERVLADYDWALITDADMLMYAEDPNIVDQHMMHMEHDGTECYENWISAYHRGRPRMPGVHFVTRAWWERTRKAREVEAQKLRATGALDYCHDEVMIADIVAAAGLPMAPARAKLWRHHGIHVGDWRIQVQQRRGRTRRLGAIESDAMYAMLHDKEAVDMLDTLAGAVPYMKKVMRAWEMALK